VSIRLIVSFLFLKERSEKLEKTFRVKSLT